MDKQLIELYFFADISKHFPYTATRFQRSLVPRLCIIEQFPIQTEFINNLLDAIFLKKELGKMRSMVLSENVEIGTLDIFEVDVVYEEDIFVVREKVRYIL